MYSINTNGTKIINYKFLFLFKILFYEHFLATCWIIIVENFVLQDIKDTDIAVGI